MGKVKININGRRVIFGDSRRVEIKIKKDEKGHLRIPLS